MLEESGCIKPEEGAIARPDVSLQSSSTVPDLLLWKVLGFVSVKSRNELSFAVSESDSDA